MGMFNKFRQWQFSKNRLEAFSDGVFAIVITLLVLELKVPHIPHAENTEEVRHALYELAPKIFSWVISFFFIALIWLHHHNIMQMAVKSDYAVVWINNFLLLFVSFFPFPTALMGEYPHSRFLVMFWGLTTSATTLLLALLYRYNTRHYLSTSYDPKSVSRNVVLSFFAGPLIYLVAALLAWVSIRVAIIMYMLVPFIYILPLDKERYPKENK